MKKLFSFLFVLIALTVITSTTAMAQYNCQDSCGIVTVNTGLPGSRPVDAGYDCNNAGIPQNLKDCLFKDCSANYSCDAGYTKTCTGSIDGLCAYSRVVSRCAMWFTDGIKCPCDYLTPASKCVKMQQ